MNDEEIRHAEEKADRKDKKDHRERQERREKIAVKERYSYVILALIIVIMFAIFGAVMINYINSNNRAWCEIITLSTPATAPVKPANPAQNPKAEKQYEGYKALGRLSHRFGCS